MEPEYVDVNKANWNSRVPLHLQGYGLQSFRDDPNHISDVVRFDLPRLGPVAGLDAVHLQCHIGTDTLSLHRLGARMTGYDFSAPALEAARTLAAQSGASIDYVEGELYQAVALLGRARFDLVYTGIGALCWLPDIAGWARVVADLLRPGGRLFIREGHPVAWALSDPRPDGLLVIEYPYFEKAGGTRFSETITYVTHEGEVGSPDTVGFNHGLGEIFNAVWDAGMAITRFEEHTSVPWNPLGDAMVVDEVGEYRLREHPERLPLTYTLQATKR